MTRTQCAVAVLCILGCVLFMGLVAWANPASASDGPPCGPTKEILQFLAEKYEEAPMGAGIVSDNGEMMSVLVSKTGTFTLLFTSPNGKTCIGASGTDWFESSSKIPGKNL